jgi:hypothetical protein
MLSCSPFRLVHRFTVTATVFRITTLFIPYDLDDYVIYAFIYITFVSLSVAR